MKAMTPKKPQAARPVPDPLEQCWRLFEGGDQFALFEAMRICHAQRIVAPEWIVEAFFLATNRWYTLDATSLDEAFAVAYAKGTNFNALRKRRALTMAVYRKITTAHEAGGAIDDALFEGVGRELGLGRTQVKDYYSDAREATKNPVAMQMLLTTWTLCEMGAFPQRRK
jgi:hypothetical protein